MTQSLENRRSCSEESGAREVAPLESVRIVSACRTYAATMRYQHVSLAELSTVAGVGERRVRAAFYDCACMSPTAALRTAALEAVRQTLLERPAFRDAVSRVASDFGFWHLSRFAGQLFGESPHETLTSSAGAAN